MKISLSLALCALLAACADLPQSKPVDVECHGRGVITGTGSATVSIGTIGNNFTLQADCGEGFVFKQHQPEIIK